PAQKATPPATGYPSIKIRLPPSAAAKALANTTGSAPGAKSSSQQQQQSTAPSGVRRITLTIGGEKGKDKSTNRTSSGTGTPTASSTTNLSSIISTLTPVAVPFSVPIPTPDSMANAQNAQDAGDPLQGIDPTLLMELGLVAPGLTMQSGGVDHD